MRYLVGMAVIFLCSGCTGRSVTYTHYPNATHIEDFEQRAIKECAKLGMQPVFSSRDSWWWQGEPERESMTYWCR